MKREDVARTLGNIIDAIDVDLRESLLNLKGIVGGLGEDILREESKFARVSLYGDLADSLRNTLREMDRLLAERNGTCVVLDAMKYIGDEK